MQASIAFGKLPNPFSGSFSASNAWVRLALLLARSRALSAGGAVWVVVFR